MLRSIEKWKKYEEIPEDLRAHYFSRAVRSIEVE
jgi:hypothetical protein